MQIPCGSTISYQELAKRAVGNANGKNLIAIISCHRVIAKDGSMGGFSSEIDINPNFAIDFIILALIIEVIGIQKSFDLTPCR